MEHLNDMPNEIKQPSAKAAPLNEAELMHAAGGLAPSGHDIWICNKCGRSNMVNAASCPDCGARRPF